MAEIFAVRLSKDNSLSSSDRGFKYF